MEELANTLFSNPDVLSMRTVLEFILFMSILEFIGWIITWVRSVN